MGFGASSFSGRLSCDLLCDLIDHAWEGKIDAARIDARPYFGLGSTGSAMTGGAGISIALGAGATFGSSSAEAY